MYLLIYPTNDVTIIIPGNVSPHTELEAIVYVHYDFIFERDMGRETELIFFWHSRLPFRCVDAWEEGAI